MTSSLSCNRESSPWARGRQALRLTLARGRDSTSTEAGPTPTPSCWTEPPINDHANGTPGGAAGQNLGVDGVQEFKINTSVSPAEFGWSSGGVISAVTRSGTNEFHGAGFEFLRNNALDSPGYFDDVKHGGTGTTAPYRRNQFGGAVGGPIKKDKTFFFGTYEGLRLGNGVNWSPQVPTLNTRNGILPLGSVKNPCTAPKTQAFSDQTTAKPLTSNFPPVPLTSTLPCSLAF